MNDIAIEEADFTAIKKLTADLKKAVSSLGPREVRYLVDTYYRIQEYRTRVGLQTRELNKSSQPHLVVDWLGNNFVFLENQVKSALNAYSESQPMGRWAMQHVGIGPVISSGLLAHVDIAKCPTYGHLWSFSGLTTGYGNPVQWKKGEKRPWNAKLKVLWWKASDCFVKFSGHKDKAGNFDCFYGQQYVKHKELLIARNLAGEFKSAADDGLKRVGKTTDAYKAYEQGILPDGHIHARAMRWTAKLFSSHWWEEYYKQTYHKLPPSPYPIAHLGHVHKIESPVPSLATLDE
jgi:hypothetical protein